MYITWLGHSCFRLESAGYGLVIDPYRVVAGYPPLRVEANAVYISHHHFDHDCLEAVTLLPGGKNPFTVETFSTSHDDCQGALRGDNTVHIFRAEGMTVVHLGDLGCALTAAQEEKISGCDALMLPVGGTYTIDAAAAAELVRRLHPTGPAHAFPGGPRPLAGADHAGGLSLRLPEQPVHRLTGETLDLTSKGTSGVVIFPRR